MLIYQVNGYAAEKQSWSFTERNQITTAIWRIAYAEADEYYRSTGKAIEPEKIFRQTFGGRVRFNKLDDVGPLVNGNSVYGYYGSLGGGKVGIQTYSNAKVNVKWTIHEFGHYFEARVNNAVGERWYVRNMLGDDSSIDRRVPGDKSHFSGFAGHTFGWQQSKEATTGEEFTDMFIGWTYRRWEPGEYNGYSEQGLARSNFMNLNMADFIDLAMGS